MSDIISVINPPTTGNTEDSFQSLWNAPIMKPIKLACPNEKYNQILSSNISTKQLHPDFSFTLDGTCLVRGEEKGPNTDNNPAEELHQS